MPICTFLVLCGELLLWLLPLNDAAVAASGDTVVVVVAAGK